MSLALLFSRSALLFSTIFCAYFVAATVGHATETPPPLLPLCSEAASSYDMARSEPYADFAARAHRRSCRKPWTILVYMAADNDLAPFAFWDLYEMEAGYRSGRKAAGSTPRTDLLVQLALPGAAGSPRIHLFQAREPYDDSVDLPQFRAQSLADIRSPLVELAQPGSDFDAFDSFVRWGTENYPSDHTFVVVWGHGDEDGLTSSEVSHAHLSIQALHQGLAGHSIDLFASDACRMQTLEVASEISDSARFILGSTQLENYLGLPYRRLLFELNVGHTIRRAEDEPAQVARLLPRLQIESLRHGGLHSRFAPKDPAAATAQLGALSSQELRSSLWPAMRAVALALDAYLAENPLRALWLQQAIFRDEPFSGGARDLGNFLAALQTLPQTTGNSEAPLALSAALAQSALTRSGVASDARAESHALSVWIPFSAEERDARLGQLSSSVFYQQMGGAWEAWLGRLY